DYLKITPSHFAALAAAAGAAEVAPRKALIFGGEALRRELVETVRVANVRCALFNHYGPTETTVGVLTSRLDTVPRTQSDTAPIGSPLPNVSAYILDEQLRPVPAGCRGELYIGGASVARGYLN